jgi:hypothetical protein
VRHLHGFVEMNRNGYRIFGHGGDTVWFHSILALFPVSRTGLFASYNTNTGANARDELLKAFVDRYYPKPDTPAPPSRPGARERARRLAGSYSSMRISHTSPAKMAMLANTSEVSVDKEGRLVTKSSAGAHRWAEVEDFVYRQMNGTETIAFRVDETSGAVYAFRSPYAASMKLTGVATPAFQIGLPIVSMILLISGLVIWPRAAVRIRKKGAARTSAVFAAPVSSKPALQDSRAVCGGAWCDTT